MAAISSSVMPSRPPITTCWPHSYGALQRQPARRMASSRSRPESVDLVRTWLAKTSHRFMSFGCCAIVPKTLRTSASSSRSVDSAPSSSRVSGSASASETGWMRGVIATAYGDAVANIEYDEFGLFHENAEEVGLPFDGPPTVERVAWRSRRAST